MEQYVQSKYQALLHGERETVSVHFRFPVHAADVETFFPKQPSDEWYRRVMQDYFDVSKVEFVIFSENHHEAERILQPIDDASFRYTLVHEEEDFANSLLLMSLCKHHIVGSSSFGFWGMFGHATVYL